MPIFFLNNVKLIFNFNFNKIKMEDIFKYQIPKHLKYKDLEKYSSKDKNIFNVWKDKLKRLKKNYELFPEKLINMIGEERFLEGAEIEWKHEWLGSTGYIDNIISKELINNLSYGKDDFGRSFVFVKVTNEKEDNFALIIFQRYANGSSFCCIESKVETDFKADAFLGGSCAICYEFEERLNKLFQNGEYTSEKDEYSKYFYIKLL
jgi:hypothetical protein